MHIAELILVLITFCVFGLSPAALLFRRERERGFRLHWAPFLGPALLSLLGLNSSLLGVTALKLVWLLLGAAVAAAGFASGRPPRDGFLPT